METDNRWGKCFPTYVGKYTIMADFCSKKGCNRPRYINQASSAYQSLFWNMRYIKVTSEQNSVIRYALFGSPAALQLWKINKLPWEFFSLQNGLKIFHDSLCITYTYMILLMVWGYRHLSIIFSLYFMRRVNLVYPIDSWILLYMFGMLVNLIENWVDTTTATINYVALVL